jgi:hypothetical protein
MGERGLNSPGAYENGNLLFVITKCAKLLDHLKKCVLFKKDAALWSQSEVRREWTPWLWYWVLRPIKFVFCVWVLKFLRRWKPVFWSCCARFDVVCSPVNGYLTFERICSVRLQRRLKIKSGPEDGENKYLRNIYNLMRWQRYVDRIIIRESIDYAVIVYICFWWP